MSEIQKILNEHRLTQRDVAEGSGITLSAVSDIVTRKRSPRAATINRLLAYLRRFEPDVTYEQLFGAGEGKAA